MFLIFYSFEQNIAATALFLATKAEENCRKTKEIVIAVAKVAQKNSSLIIDEQSKEFWRWKDSILLHEEMMLELLTFDVVLESPYTSLSNFIRELDIENNKNLRNAAWAFLNDSCMTTLCLQMPPKDIAVASLYFSAKFNHDRIPDDHDGAPWWLSIGGDPNRITKAIAVMREHYTEDPLKKSNNPYDQSPTWSVEDLERTRLRAESRSPISRRQAEDLAMNDEGEIDDKKNGHLEEADVKHEIAEGSQLTAVAGDDDTKLKLAANDPATHEAVNGETNGALASPLPSVKRKDAPLADTEATEISVAKRPKVERETEESEEGEVEE